MKITTKTIWVTSDDKQFDSADEAHAHAIELTEAARAKPAKITKKKKAPKRKAS